MTIFFQTKFSFSLLNIFHQNLLFTRNIFTCKFFTTNCQSPDFKSPIGPPKNLETLYNQVVVRSLFVVWSFATLVITASSNSKCSPADQTRPNDQDDQDYQGDQDYQDDQDDQNYQDDQDEQDY